MKKTILFAAALVLLAACNVSDIDKQSPAVVDGNSFVKGQKVTLTVGTGNQTKVSSELVTSGEDKDKVNFKWETGDKILVKVGEASAEFTLKSGAGSATATFEGTMPEDGTTFDVQFPVTDPDLTTQTYSATEAIPHDMMKFTASGCTVGDAFALTAVNAALRLNLYADVTIGKIVVTDKSASPEVSYTLTCTDGVKNNTGNETMPFFIILPAGSRNIEAKVYGTGETPALICTRTTTSARTFVNGQVLNMPLKYDYPGTDAQPTSITTGDPATTTVWAPVNCGYEPANGEYKGYTYGKLYQWGRKDGQGYKDTDYEDASYPSGDNIVDGPISTIPTASDAEKFYKNAISPWNWYNGKSPANLTLWSSSKTAYDPCPDGWRVPTDGEIWALMGNHTVATLQDGSGVHCGMKGRYFDGSSTATPTSGVFLPAAGVLYNYDGKGLKRNSDAYYWTSTHESVYFTYTLQFRIDSTPAINEFAFRSGGLSVRCVQE